MSAKTSGVNVVRYSALCLGVFYGFYHQRSITQSQRAAAAQREYEHKQKLIDQAKREYAKTKQPASSAPAPAKAADSGDLGEYLEAWLGKV
ncbi:ATP synthase E chain-domain-containing protein [Podospora aff. communis PSN243]|uniref:ATP synthase F(0) complex subunit e, mitochondrial n=1 Tax=Podospora aff. communis PSN243 TaxID=3040156 RepID=A0AAV9GSK4_9PEZI|nr:ATP synthase E chain-domain-containing protein [Podospora aff. communis PSN243]